MSPETQTDPNRFKRYCSSLHPVPRSIVMARID
jgi:hypothetical protein